MKIKTFQFPLSNYQGNFTSPHFWNNPLRTLHKSLDAYLHEAFDGKIYTEQQIDETINGWLKDSNADVVDIRINHYTIHRHNNAGADSIIAVYTILYKD